VLADVVELIRTLQPTEIYVTSGADAHIDHRAAFWFVRDAVKTAGYKGAFYSYLVHAKPNHAWPWPEGITPKLPFAAHRIDGEEAPHGLPWPPSKRVPLSLKEAGIKLKAIQAHDIHVVGNPDHQKNLESFVKSEEVFWLP
jgi:LmbE family N-acetylglucosaminyl deacetylase